MRRKAMLALVIVIVLLAARPKRPSYKTNRQPTPPVSEEVLDTPRSQSYSPERTAYLVLGGVAVLVLVWLESRRQDSARRR